MSKFNVLCATVLLAASGAASASVVPTWYTQDVLMKDKTSYTFKTNSDAIKTYDIGLQSGAVLVDYTFSFTGTPKNNAYLGLWFGDMNGPNFGMKANCGDGSCTDDAFIRYTLGNETYMDGSALVAGQSYHLVAYLYKNSGSIGTGSAYDGFKMWLNPTAYELATLSGADASASGANKLSSFDTIGFRTANIGGGVAVNVSNVTVTAVPEPATLSLFGLAAAGLAVARRRKKA